MSTTEIPAERVTFTSTGATGVIVARFVNDGPYAGDLAGDWATVTFDDGETIDVKVTNLTFA